MSVVDPALLRSVGDRYARSKHLLTHFARNDGRPVSDDFLLREQDTWLEQAGEVELVGGWAYVALANAFRRGGEACRYEVLVSSYDPAIVFVQNRTASGFEINAMAAPSRRRHVTVRCSYRVIARMAGS